jgi:hypothetical protein
VRGRRGRRAASGGAGVVRRAAARASSGPPVEARASSGPPVEHGRALSGLWRNIGGLAVPSPRPAAATRCRAGVTVAGPREAGGAVAGAGDAGAAGAQGHHRLQGADGGGAQVGRRRPGEAGPAARASQCRGPAYKKDKPR